MSEPIRRRRLKAIKVDEVSFVDRPANLRNFLFFKNLDPKLAKADGEQAVNVDLQFTSDGTVSGTSLTVNGKAVKDLSNLFLSFCPACPDKDMSGGAMAMPMGSEPPDEDDACLCLTYGSTDAEPDANGIKQSKTFKLCKNVEVEDVTEDVGKALGQDAPTKGGFLAAMASRKKRRKAGEGGEVMPAGERAMSQGNAAVAKAADADLEALRGVAQVADDVDADLAKALAPHAARVALYRADLPQDLDKAIQGILALACQTEGAIGVEKDMAEQAPKTTETTPAAPAAAPVPEAPKGLSDEDVGRIAAKVAETLAKKDEPAAPAAGQEDEEQDIDPAELGRELAQATVETLRQGRDT